MKFRLLIAAAHVTLLAAPRASGQCLTETLAPTDPGSFPSFGSAVAVDDNRVVVGARSATAGTVPTAGAVYVFEGGVGSWVQAQKLIASDASSGDSFGASVAVFEDTIVVGAPTAGAGLDSGVAYVFERGPSGFVQTARLVGSMTINFEHFGVAVDVDGDVIVVGGPDHSPPFRSGFAYVFERSGSTWIETIRLSPVDNDIRDQFGGWVQVEGDTIAVSATGKESPLGADYQGVVYIFGRMAGTWVQVARLTASDGLPGDAFGSDLQLSHDTLAAGAVGHDAGSGAAYVFERDPTGVWSEVAELAGTALGVTGFGDVVALDGERLLVNGFPFQRLKGIWQLTSATQSVPAPSFVAHALQGTRAIAGDRFSNPPVASVVELNGPLGTPSCAANPNSTGQGATLTAYGNNDVLFNCLELLTAPVPTGQFGYYLMARTQGFVPLFAGSQGNLCLSLPIVRFRQNILQAGPAQEMRFAPDLTALPQNTTFLPGETWTFQCWFRDLNPALTSNTSSGLAVTFRSLDAPTVQLPIGITDVVEEAAVFELPVTLSQTADVDVTVPYALSGTATVDLDFQLPSPNPIVVPAGRSSSMLRLVILEDSLQESDETVTITLMAPTGGVLGTATTHTATIRDDD